MRNLTKTLAIVSLLVPASAYPLGIGEIKLHSALNQNLDAEIALVLAPGEKASDIKVSLAPPDKFDQSGVPWTYFLSKLKFQAVESSGSVIIKVTSREALKEPFLDFLLEVTWPKGNLYREFTVLVDPPAVYEQPTLPVTVQSEENYGVGQEVPVRAQPMPRPQPKHRIRAATVASAGQYGPTVRNDTLWNVAERISANTGVSVEQTMIALYEANPRAFYKQNVNALLAGETLKIPEREVILRLSRQQALAEFNRQNQAWRNRSVEPIQNVAVADETVDKQLTLVAPKQDTVNENAVVTAETEAQIADKGHADATTDKPVAVAPQASDVQTQTEAVQKPADSDKAASTVTAADAALNARVSALEKQLAVMQELIALKDQQLATLQGQGQKPAVEKPQTQAPVISNPVQPPVPVAEKPAAPTPVAPKPTVQPKVTTVAAPQTETELEWLYLLGGAAGLGGLCYGGWVLWRKRQQDTFETEHYAFADTSKVSRPAEISKSAIFAESNDQGMDSDTGALSFGSDFAANEFDMFEMDQGEIDPVSEADVYLAYGRYQQAEELMRHAIRDLPDRDDFKLKLLEIFYASENKQAFESYANQLFDAGKNSDNVFWSKVVEMGNEICPDSLLFATQKQATVLKKEEPVAETAKKPDQAGAENQLLDDMDFDLTSFEELFGGESLANTSTGDNGLSGSDDKYILDNTKQELDFSDEPTPNNEAIEFDFSAFSTDSGKLDKDFKGAAANEAEEEESGSVALLDFDAAADSDEQFFDVSRFSSTDFAQMDEMETKLDLAIAYVDMGDAEAAKEIALEVFNKGSKEQQMIAKSLLDNLQ